MLAMSVLTPAVLTLLSPAAAAAGSKPHIVHFMADDLGWNDLGRFNGGLTITPAIDGLIQQGVILQRFHTFKVCAPSRASTLVRYAPGCMRQHASDLHARNTPRAGDTHSMSGSTKCRGMMSTSACRTRRCCRRC
jgi:hypothetical protein